MSFWSTFPFVRITIFFIGGIVWAYYRLLSYEPILIGTAVLVACYLILARTIPRAKLYTWNPWLGLLGLTGFFLAGALCFLNYRTRDTSPQFHHQVAAIEGYVAVVLEEVATKEDHLAVTVGLQKALMQGSWEKVTGKIRLCIETPCIDMIQYGDVYIILGTPQPIAAPRNPEEFNYKTFLDYDNIYYQHHVSQGTIQKLAYQPPSRLQVVFFKLRKLCKETLTQYIHGARERSIVLALVLGIKDELDWVIRGAYASSGTMHVLAVSGLHVGILYGLLSFLLRSGKKHQRGGWMRALLLLTGLWIYAGITGLTPSVLRATLLFSFVVLAKLLGKTSRIYNVLAASALVLLLWNPVWIFSVSFQLSYLAVLGIVYLQPKIYHWIRFNNFILRQLWLWTSVSLAAQLATTPISLYYFHQFPIYFIVANWVVVPAAFLIFTLGLGVLLASFWGKLSSVLGWLLEQLTWLVNQFVAWISQLPYNVVTDIYIDSQHLFLWYGLLISILLFLHKKTFQTLVIAHVVVLLLGISTVRAVLAHQSQRGVIFYSMYPNQVLTFFTGMQGTLLIDEEFTDYHKKFNYHIKPSYLAMGIGIHDRYTFTEAVDTPHIPLQDWNGLKIAVWSQKKFIFIDKPGIDWPVCNKKIFTDFLVIENNSVKSLKPLLGQFEWGTLVIGASNSRSLAAQLQLEAKQLQVTSHALGKDGALKVYW